ncbi:uncharacterized protein LOC131953445 [Physella acuta]|uniref:uncharacterized protein LOC131953445 n=1 Tax=Physella acuta TaxID=109671 RepID=UPI0027DDD0D1|nr:uncharacterized protein LOC131953445 [Physella acuta]
MNPTLQVTLTIFTATLMFCSTTGDLQFLWGENQEYNSMCKYNDTWAVPLDDSKCDQTRFLLCDQDKAICLMSCPEGWKIDKNLRYCVPEDQVAPLPNCVPIEPTIPTFCDGTFTGFIPVNGTCKKYIWCVSERSYVMNCPKLSFFIPKSRACIYLTEPYINKIPSDELVRCNRMDPYKAVDFEAPKTTSTPRPF